MCTRFHIILFGTNVLGILWLLSDPCMHSSYLARHKYQN